MTKISDLKYVTIRNNRSYGNALKGIKIYYEGRKPKGLAKNGTFQFGKNIIEVLLRRLGKNFKLILTKDTDSVITQRNIHYVRLSLPTLRKMGSELIGRNRDIKNDIIKSVFANIYADHFKDDTSQVVYVPGTISSIISPEIVTRLSVEDRESLNQFIPKFLLSESQSSINLLKATVEIQSLKDLAADMEANLGNNRSESWWQKYIQSNILIIQQGYIKAIGKINIAVGETKFPDFSLVTHDNYLDIMEIKKPSTTVIKLDSSRNNYYWDVEMAKAVIQVENYIATVSRHADAVRNFLRDRYKIDLQVLRPRGIILAGNASDFADQKTKDDFRLLCQSMKNLSVVTYDELLVRLKNYIQVLEGFRK